MKIVIIGATSAIAEATARLLAARGDSLFLIARNARRLAALAQDLSLRGSPVVKYAMLDVRDFDLHDSTLTQADASLNGFDVALIAYGTLSDQRACEWDVDLLQRELTTNATSVVMLATRLANYFSHKRAGTLVVISSVAGDRGRRSNYAYGSAKALVSTFLSGLRQRLHSTGLTVLTIKPGWVDTPMTAGFSKNRLWVDAGSVARGIVDAIDRKRDVAYLPSFWRTVMLCISLIPESIFKRLNL